MFSPNDHVVDHVDAYLHDALSRDDARYVDRHCQECRVCQVALEEAQRRFDALKALPPVEASEELIQATTRRVAVYREPRITPRRVGWALVAAAVLAAVGLHVYYFSLQPSPYDLRLVGQNELIAGSDASLRVVLVDRRSGEPVEGASVDIELAGRRSDQVVHLASFTTDRFGSGNPQFQLPEWTDGQYELRVHARPGWSSDSVVRPIKLKRSWQLMVSTDKPVYQPGQAIRVRGLALRRPDLKPVAGQEAVFSIADPKGNVIFRQRSVTSRFGITSADCPLAAEIIEGLYKIECQLGDAKGTAAVEVKKYVLPKFKIDVKLDRPYYQPGQMLRGTVRADYFFGRSLDQGEVTIDARATNVEAASLGSMSLKTDASGKAAFEFLVPRSLAGRPQDSGDARVALEVTVRDSAGQRETKTLSAIVTERPIRIEVIPEAGTLVRGVANTIYVFTSYPDGRPAVTRIAVSGIDRELRTNSLGVASFTFTPTYDVQQTVRATDDNGLTSVRSLTLLSYHHLFQPSTYSPAGEFLVRTDKAVYDGGQTVRLLVLGSGTEPVFLDLVKDGQTMLTETIEVQKGRGEFDFDLPPDVFGTVELCAYRFDAAGLPVCKNRAIYVRQPGGLKVQTRLDRPEYRPGDRAKLTFTLTDGQGKPVPGALSLAAVDEAVFSVLGQAPGMERTFFTLEQKVLEPVYAIYDWSPELALGVPTAERDEFEQALFARTAMERPCRDRSNRLEELINKYAEGSWSLLEVLKRPDWEQMAENMQLPQELIQMLREQGPAPGMPAGSHFFVTSSFPGQSQQVEAAREKCLVLIELFWCAVGFVVAVALVVLFIRALANTSVTVVQVLTVVVVIMIVISLMLPASQSAREAARRVSGVNDLKQLWLAFENSREGKVKEEAASEKTPAQPPAPPRLRQWFPETLLWRPELITDDAGRATLDLELADSITTWRLAASAVSAEGKLGAEQAAIRVFQPFFVDLDLPVALTRGDEVTLSAVVYNYLDKPQTVELKLAEAAWFERLDEAAKKLDLTPNEVRSVGFRIRIKRVGRHELRVDATGTVAAHKEKVADGVASHSVADAIKREIEVVPDGRPVEQVVNGTLQQPASVACSVPAEAIEGSVRGIVKIYPSSFSQLVEGLDGIFQRPSGCFEQTSSTTYPNVLALDYLRRTGRTAPEVEAKARQFIHLGYQRLLGFEVSGGGFDWFGHPPAKLTLTAYGLMEFQDMARVHDVDPRLIERTRTWLLARQNADGTWDPADRMLHGDPTDVRSDLARLSTTAYVGWAVFGDQMASPQSQRTLQWLLAWQPDRIGDPYVLALVANAVAAMSDSQALARPYVERLEAIKRLSGDGKLAWWEQGPGRRTMFYGAGTGGSVETTALATLALVRSGQNPATARAALAWLTAQKDRFGTWHSTQATVLALKALLAGTGRPLGGDRERTIQIALDGKTVRTVTIPADQGDVVQQIDLSGRLTPGTHQVQLTDRSDTASGYQVAFRYHVPGDGPPREKPPLAIRLDYDRTELVQGDAVMATATIENRMPSAAPMVVLDLPIPAGFAVESGELTEAVTQGRIARFQVTPRSTIVYLRELQPGQPLVVRYRLRATMPVRVSVPPARAYEYYDPAKEATSPAARLTVNPRA